MRMVAQVTGPSAVLERMAEMIVAELERTEADGVEETGGAAEETGEKGEANFFTTRYSCLW